MASDPRVHKPRLPKAYTDQQLAFLKSHLPEFERRSQGSIRGDAKKFALERAAEFIANFGLPDEFMGVEESESRFREQIYNWFKNTVGRTRRKLEGRPRSAKKAAEKAAAVAAAAAAAAQTAVTPSNPNELQQWPGNVSSPTIVPYPHAEASTSPVNAPQPIIQPIQYTNLQPTPAPPPSTLQPTPPAAIQPPPPIPQSASSPHHHPHPHPHATTTTALALPMTQVVSQSDLRDAFLQGLDASTVSSMIQTFILSNPNPSPTPLTPVVEALFEAISADSTSLSYSRDHLHLYLRRYFDAASYFPEQVVHAGVGGPMSGTRALQMLIRKYSTWIPHAPPLVHSSTASSSRTAGGAGAGPSTPRVVPGVTNSTPGLSPSLSEEMQRIAADRQRKKDHIQWARIHAAALELGVLGLGRVGDTDNSGYTYAMGRAFSEMMARDAVWESDEVEWVAGICVLRSVIRTAMRGDRRQRDEYDELLRTYEGRWKEIKDEARQALVTDVLLGAREDLSRMLEESLS